ncbi:MAG: ABC transporter ATP-binding protein/permease [Clostridiales bacterium]|nr:ABC transporter ATP-binding protein/permease [Clostridiales bacterium]
MLKLVNINKVYTVGDMRVEALKNVSLEFRKNEMVSILGPSGCGKTTMLNIIGGLDKYTSGDLIINGVSTKEYRECDWDAYRNASIGFVFQSYNLISHQTVLENVELALTLSGVSQSERKQRAIKALEEVGLGDQLKKKPNQLSGGQMQRVAIARALINNPDIVLADEPTGALDSVTSVQIMDLLKEVAKTRLVILVTHNGELAEQYSDRIIKLLDGKVVSDTNPVKPEGEQKTTKQRPKKTAMSFISAFKLSIRNLFTKKMRTFITSFAGSIGIIGVALILALSSGFSGYIDRMQKDTMSSYPLTIASASVDVTSMMSLVELPGLSKYPTAQEVYINKITEKLQATITSNEITDEYVQNAIETIDKDLVTDIVYNTGAAINLYKKASVDDNGNVEMKSVDMNGVMGMGGWKRIINNPELISSQYDILQGKLPGAKNELVLVVDDYNQLLDISIMGALGIDAEDIKDKDKLTFDEIFSLEYKLVLNDELYDQRSDGTFYKNTLLTEQEYNDSLTMKIVGIVRLKEEATGGSLSGTIGYHGDLTQYILEQEANSGVVEWQKANPDIRFTDGASYFELAKQNSPFKDVPDFMLNAEMTEYIKGEAEKLKNDRLANLGGRTTPIQIDIYPKDFETKELIKDHLNAYNDQLEQQDKSPVAYSDMMGFMFDALGVMVDAVSYVLIAFTSISLVVSSIMIGVITYTSVLERTKEIGILKALGARKKDISRVFNAETISIGFAAGVIGVLFTWIVAIPINSLLYSLTTIPNLMYLGIVPAIILVGISVLLTFIAGLVPSRVAAKKDAVIALRTE